MMCLFQVRRNRAELMLSAQSGMKGKGRMKTGGIRETFLEITQGCEMFIKK